VKEARKTEERAERLRLYYVAMTRAIDRLIVSGSIDPGRTADETTPIGWVLGRLDARAEIEQAQEPVELEREGVRLILRVDRFAEEPTPAAEPEAEDGQLALFAEGAVAALPALVPALPPLADVPAPPLHRVRRLSFSALALFERCSYRYYAERVVGMRPTDERNAAPGTTGLAATEIGDAVHRLLELVNLQEPLPPGDLVALVRGWYPRVNDEELERIAGFVRSYCDSDLARRVATLSGTRPERPFAFEHDGVLLHGRLDVLQQDGDRALVVDYKTNSLDEGTPEEIVDHDYRLQRLVYALACFRAGAQEVEVVYHFLERPDAVVSTVFERAQLPELEGELSDAIARINAGEFRPTPDDFICAGCPALDVVCAGPRLRSALAAEAFVAA
jgi:ATP-dependent helicase/nuclease subunit A